VKFHTQQLAGAVKFSDGTRNFERDVETIYQTRRHLSQMHILYGKRRFPEKTAKANGGRAQRLFTVEFATGEVYDLTANERQKRRSANSIPEKISGANQSGFCWLGSCTVSSNTGPLVARLISSDDEYARAE